MKGKYKVRIITSAGLVAYHKEEVLVDGEELTLDASNLGIGVYMLELTDEKGNKQTSKMIRE